MPGEIFLGIDESIDEEGREAIALCPTYDRRDIQQIHSMSPARRELPNPQVLARPFLYILCSARNAPPKKYMRRLFAAARERFHLESAEVTVIYDGTVEQFPIDFSKAQHTYYAPHGDETIPLIHRADALAFIAQHYHSNVRSRRWEKCLAHIKATIPNLDEIMKTALINL